VGDHIHFQSPALEADSPTLARPLAGSSFHFQSPTFAAVPPTLPRPLSSSSTGPSPGAPDGGALEAVGVPTHFQNTALAALPPILSPPLAGYSTVPSPGTPEGVPPEAMGAPTHWCSPWCTHWYKSDLSRLKVPDQTSPAPTTLARDQLSSPRPTPHLWHCTS